MNESKISVRYSKAIFELAIEKKLLDEISADMVFISEICKIDEVKEVIDSPIIVPSKKTKIMHGLLENNVNALTLTLVDLLVKNGREGYLPAVARVFRDNTLQYQGITESYLTTAEPVNDTIRKQMKELISSIFKTKVELRENIDKEIIGGFVLRVNDNFIDASVRNKLRKIRKELSFKTARSI